ncbi:translation initiation factor IF-2 [Patescibacteria group bacterium]|nr:translation initiation factor IF-2 [Patescibacteria group bacterium]
MARTPRPPIVAVMGHIDHGKSSLLDYIRKSNVTAGEAGGITQHVSAYEAEHAHEGVLRTITFLDTPGHEAFRALRARGAQVADVAILVVAADEAVKPQTKEAHEAIEEAGIPYVIAFTKMDKNGADIERAKASVIENGIYLEGLGGSIPYVPVSSKTGEGIPGLLDLVLLTADLAELTADATLPATGFVLESSQDPKRGVSATLIIKDGTLTTGSVAVAGQASTPVRFIENFLGKRIPEGKASQPVSISGWNGLPAAGTPFSIVANKKEAEKIMASGVQPTNASRIREDATAEGKELLPIIIKADVTGSIEAIIHELSKATHDRAALQIVHEGVGSVSEGDVKTAQAGGATIIAFHVGTDQSARELAERAGVQIETFDIIYDLEKKVGELLLARAPKVRVEEILGEAKILKVFNATGSKQVIGARLDSGAVAVGNLVKINRRGLDLGSGKITNLQQARADVKEIRTEGEFGGQIETKAEVAGGDTITFFRIVES